MTTERKSRQQGDWKDRHLRACLMCGRAWRRRRRKTCPRCSSDLSICLTCDRAWAAEKAERQCPEPVTALRELAKACAGDWEWAKRALRAAAGDVSRARVDVERARREQRPGR